MKIIKLVGRYSKHPFAILDGFAEDEISQCRFDSVEAAQVAYHAWIMGWR